MPVYREGEMRIAAGILMIVGGFGSAVLWITFLQPLDLAGFIFLQIFFTLFGILSLYGGIYTLRRVRWGWSLVGAICSINNPIFGIPAIILLLKSKREFQSVQPG